VDVLATASRPVLSALIAALYLLVLAVSLVAFHTVDFRWYWTIPSVLLLVERVWSVWGMGWRARIYAALFLPEQLYTLLLTYIYSLALVRFIRGHKGAWVAT
jgi:hypothetical protein